MKQYWVIENHLDGGFYLMSEDIPEEELGEIETPCEMCGDNDSIIGQFSDWQQLKRQMTDAEGWCPYSDEYLQSVFEEDNQ
ncbi:hypothetical protein EFN85_14275 [Lactococcus lactis]|jgi:hypothetical protein|uniref:hypothetical protein n=1 Tax=Lactococcus lactis TaxID=1358 RepID=UPI00207C70A0|nr:hypothetical protein [Lactococcus lactis]MCO0815370.1 hypothetical protein [Lactococcus lactis]MCT0045003.1 hypothetical protein [Lactococcus lactis subsp. lactis]MCT3091010.1 hypothetical protein [Lactococcus lactis]